MVVEHRDILKEYTDNEIEQVLIDLLKKNADVFISSPRWGDSKICIKKDIDSFSSRSRENIIYSGETVFNNFTDARENLINWYPFKDNASVLEIGAGMGALTGVLCSRCKQVVAIEHSPKRAEIIRLRYNKKENLQVICGDIYDQDFSQKFDYILLIGVLEYMGINCREENPYKKLLDKVNNLLAPGGVLLLAIENQYGLKYWCGSAEDHTGVPFDGIAGYASNGYTTRYNSEGVRTFSKAVLQKLLQDSGLSEQRWYYPLPDYKFPMAVFSDEYLPHSSDIDAIKFNYPIESELIANEKQIYKELIDNQVFPFFANSFMIEASRNELPAGSVKCAMLKRDYKSEYRISTIIDSQGQVIKRCICDEAAPHLKRYVSNLRELAARDIPIVDVQEEQGNVIQPWQDLPRTDGVLKEYLLNGEWDEITRLLDVLTVNIKKSSDVYLANTCNMAGIVKLDFQAEQEILPDGYLDMTFVNSFVSHGEILFFDQEWKHADVPVKYILYRAIKYAYVQNNSFPLDSLYQYVGIDDNMAKQFHEAETKILESLMDEQKCRMFDPNMYHEGLTLQYKLQRDREISEQREREVQECRQTINNQNGHIELLLESERKYQRDIQISEQRHRQEQQESEQKHQQERQESEHKHQQELQDLRQTILNKEGHIQLLLEVEREYQREKHSRTYRMALIFRRISTFFLPVGSRRRFLCKVLAKGIRHPLRMMRMVNPRRIKNCFTILKNEGAESAALHLRLVEEFERSGSVESTLEKLDIVQVEQPQVEQYSLEDYSALLFTLPAEPLVSIIIPAYNQFDYTYHCLESIQKHSGDVAYEILLADDCSTDLTESIEKIVTGIRHLRTENNLRFLRNCNNAAKQVKGKYILFLNNDTQVQENWLQPLVDLLESDASIGMTGSKLVYPDGHLQEAGGIFWKDASAWNYGHMQNPEDPEFNYIKEADFISGASIMIRRDLWEEIGGFDERFAPAYYEDADLAFEVRRHGYKVVYQPLSVVVHFEGISNGTDLTTGQKKYQVDNQQKFYDKWKDVLETEHFPNGENVFLAKDRSRSKKQILVVDHYVPHYDKDAGGKCTYMYLLLFVQMGFKVTFIGDNFYKHEPYTTDLNQHGIEVLYGNYYCSNWEQWLKDNLHYFDYVYLQRPHISIKYIDLVKQYGHAKVFYYDLDLHHVREYREYLLTHDEEKLKSSERWKKIEYELFEKADVGHVVGSYEESLMQEAFPGKPIRNIPLYIYEEMLTDVNKNFEDRNDLIFVGGFGHPPNTDAVLWFSREVFPKILEKYPDMKWHVVGGKAPEEVQSLASNNILIEGFLPDEELHSLYHKSRMAVVPLRVGAGVKGKVVEAAYYQIPLVTTTIGAEGLDTSIGNMIVEDDADRMAELICELYENHDKLREMSDAGEAFIRKHFTVEVASNVLSLDL